MRLGIVWVTWQHWFGLRSLRNQLLGKVILVCDLTWAYVVCGSPRWRRCWIFKLMILTPHLIGDAHPPLCLIVCNKPSIDWTKGVKFLLLSSTAVRYSTLGLYRYRYRYRYRYCIGADICSIGIGKLINLWETIFSPNPMRCRSRDTS